VNRITWLGHSTVVIELGGACIVTDPLLRRRVAHLRRSDTVGRFATPDAVLISHVHLDHLDLPSLARIGRSVPVVVPRHAGAVLRLRRFACVVEVDVGDELELGGTTLTVVPADHGTVKRYVRERSAAVGFVVGREQRVYFAGDTDLFDGMADVAPLDVALLPVAGWGPRLPPGHLDPHRAAEALALLRPRTAIPIHWGTYRAPRAAAPDDGPARAFEREAAALAPEVDVRVLRLGESLTL
jgi:L-ascorbate metabolism protein UlaG (beta-lactamase superfamily)